MVGRGAYALPTARSPRIPPFGRPRGGAIQRRMTRRRWLVAAGGAVLGRRHWSAMPSRCVGGEDVRGSPTVEFVTTDVPQRTVLAPIPTTRSRPRPERDSTGVGHYGYDDRRLRFAPGIDLRPPFRRIWTFRGRALLEFPPAVAYGRLYLPTFDGRFYALDSRRRARRSGAIAPAAAAGPSPAVRGARRLRHVHRAPIDLRRLRPRDGIVVAYDADSGRIVRQRTTFGLNESSPLVAAGRVYVGDWDGRIWALDARTGRTRWTPRPAAGSRGCSPCPAAGCTSATTTEASTPRMRPAGLRLARLGATTARRAGRLYSTPAVGYGRVFIGNTDGKVYAYGAASGRLLWSRARVVRSQPSLSGAWLILVGSYDHSFYALMPRRATSAGAGRTARSRSASVIAIVVYFSTFAERTQGARRGLREGAVALRGREVPARGRRPRAAVPRRPRQAVRDGRAALSLRGAAGAGRQMFSSSSETSGHSAEPPKFSTPAANTLRHGASRNRSSPRSCRGRRRPRSAPAPWTPRGESEVRASISIP